VLTRRRAGGAARTQERLQVLEKPFAKFKQLAQNDLAQQCREVWPALVRDVEGLAAETMARLAELGGPLLCELIALRNVKVWVAIESEGRGLGLLEEVLATVPAAVGEEGQSGAPVLTREEE
jgi:hypothetical protein